MTEFTRNGQPVDRLSVLYEDNHLIAVVKPPGILSQADETGEPDMVTLLKRDLKEKYAKPGNVFVGLVHRLDRPVGGVMLFAKTSKAASRLSESVRSRSFAKTYAAVVSGAPRPPAGRLRHYLSKDPARNIVTVHDLPAAGAKEALLDYAAVASRRGDTLIAVRLLTGRPHQIRAQMAACGHPLLGDRKYGSAGGDGLPDVALWSAALGVAHPVTREWLAFRCAPPLSEPWSRFGEEDCARAAAVWAREGMEQ